MQAWGAGQKAVCDIALPLPAGLADVVRSFPELPAQPLAGAPRWEATGRGPLCKLPHPAQPFPPPASQVRIHTPHTLTLIPHTLTHHTLTPHRYVRALHYRYEYTKIGSKEAGRGHWWKRKLIGQYLPPLSAKQVKPVLREQGWKWYTRQQA